MRIFTAFLAHETNSFSPIRTALAEFEEIGIYRPALGHPEDHLPLLKGAADFYRIARDNGDEVFVGTCALAQPSAPCERKDYEQLRDEILGQINDNGPFDAILLMMHGAMMAQGYDDCEGDLLTRVRERVGANVPVGVLLDLHCNITPDMLAAATVVLPCKEYPHTDFAERAADLYRLVACSHRGEVNPHPHFFRIPMLGLYQTMIEPMRSFVDKMLRCEQREGILAVSLAHGFPWSDMPHTGAGMLVYSDGNTAAGAALSEQLGREFFAQRQAVQTAPLQLEALRPELDATPSGTVIIADMADNPGGGAPSDATYLLRYFLDQGLTDALFGLFWDPHSVNATFEAGEGARLPLAIGGKASTTSGTPVELEVEVLALRETANQPHIADGNTTALGRTAVVQAQGLTLVLNDIRQQPFHPQAFVSAGVDPWQFRYVVVKSSFHFRAGFSQRAAATLFVDTPGTLHADPRQRPYQFVPRPLWPLDSVSL